MPEGTYSFPRGFLWGCATAAHQVEGNNRNNNWAEWEGQPGRILFDQRAGLACDWWGGRWREDLDRAMETGQNAHRFSVEWSRIQPEPGRWDDDALEFYRRMARGMLERGLRPMVTLHHFTDPLWLAAGWEDDKTPALFARYCERVVEALKEYTNLWVTINEPNVYTQGGYLGGGFPPGKNEAGSAVRVFTNLLRGHAAAYRVIHRLQPDARVGVAHHYRGFLPAHPWLPTDSLAANSLSAAFNDSFPRAIATGRLKLPFYQASLPEAAGTQDFFGLNYYTGENVLLDLFKPRQFFHRRFYRRDAALSQHGFLDSRPDVFWKALKWARGYDLPILITENGWEDAGDDTRPDYMVQHLKKLWWAANSNWRVEGYFHWTLVDNFEWSAGWTLRFGLWGLDENNQQRIRRPSVDLYEAICKQNAISSDVVSRFAPRSFPLLFPG